MLVQWAYSKSRGGNPLHTMLITWGRLGIGAAKLVLFGLIAWFAVTKYQENENLMHLLAVIVVAAAGLNWLAKSTVRHVLSWAQSPGHQRKMLFQDNHFGRALAALAESYQTVSAPSMSVTLARESLLRGHGVGAAVDQIVVAFLDRALEAREFMWPVQVPELES